MKATSSKVLELAGSDPAAASQLSHGDSEKLFGAMRDPIDKLGELEDMAANDVGTAAIELGEERSWQQGFIIVICLLVCAALAMVVSFLIARPLQNLLRHIEQIADGDLRTRLEVHSRDEPGMLSQTFNRFLDKLPPLINSEHAAVDQVSTAATE